MQGRFGAYKGGKRYYKDYGGVIPRDVLEFQRLIGRVGFRETWFLCKTCNDTAFPSVEFKNHLQHEIVRHPTQKPLALSTHLIKSKPGVLLVPFAGSGSECVAAKSLGVPFFATECNPDYVSLCNQRIKNTFTSDLTI